MKIGFSYVDELPSALESGTIYFCGNSKTIELATSSTTHETFARVCDAGEVTMRTYLKSGNFSAITQQDSVESAISKLEAYAVELQERIAALELGSNKCDVVYVLGESVSSNSTTTITKGASYSTTITPNTHYRISNVTVLMNDTNITDSVYSDGTITIPNVSGNIVITVETVKIVYTITKTASNATIDNAATNVESGTSYSATISPNEGYRITSMSVTMGGQPVSISNNTVNIASVTGNIVFNVVTTKISYTITNNLTNSVNNNSATNINYGDNYAAVITANTGYDLGTVTATMGGTPITVTGGSINISKVTGDIVITANATLKTFAITNNMSNVTSSNSATSINYGAQYTATLSPEQYYSLGTVTVIMNGTNVTSSVYNNGVITIPSVTGAIVITANANRIVYNISNALTHVSNGNATSSINAGTSYTATLIPDTGYSINSVVVKMNNVDVTNTVYSSGNINIPNVTGNIEITAIATANSVTVTYNLTNVDSSNSATTSTIDSSYTTTLSANKKNYTINSIVVSMGGTDISGTVVNGDVITIPNVTGNIIITATAGKARAIGEVITTDNSISINDGELSAGTYTMKYLDADGNEIANEDVITTFTI